MQSKVLDSVVNKQFNKVLFDSLKLIANIPCGINQSTLVGRWPLIKLLILILVHDAFVTTSQNLSKVIYYLSFVFLKHCISVVVSLHGGTLTWIQFIIAIKLLASRLMHCRYLSGQSSILKSAQIIRILISR